MTPATTAGRRQHSARLLCLFLVVNSLASSAQTPVLDAHHLLLDGSLTDEEAAARPYTYNDFRKAASQFGDSATLYIAPWVYWIDNPDTPEVVTGRNGREPFGMTIKAKKLHFIGLSERPDDVVLASQRGQMQGAVGNFTMFDFHVDTLTVENLTMGNYCNVDLDYPRRPELSRRRRSDAITQAHVGYVEGRLMTARRVRFLSRLNLNPLNGAIHSYYEDCHFECTDDALNGNATYRHCTIDLYGQKPFWSTYGQGALFINCDFTVKGHNREMYFMKQGGPLTLIDCRYHAPSDSIYIGWTAYPQPWLRCYQKNFTLNGKPYLIGHRQPQNTLQPDGLTDRLAAPPFLSINRHDASLLTGTDTLVLTTSEPAQWRVEPGYEHFVALSLNDGRSVTVVPTNNSDETARFCIIAATTDGREAACYAEVRPALLPPPAFDSRPRLKLTADGVAMLDYKLQCREALDESTITWYRDDIPQATTHGRPARSFVIDDTYKDHVVKAVLLPRQRNGEAGQPVTVQAVVKKAPRRRRLDTDFSRFYCGWQPVVAEGLWTSDGYKPSDTDDYDWKFNAGQPMWEYGLGYNGAVGYGLLQAQRGARLMYTPSAQAYGDMALTLQVDPTKTAGQGFGSATGQYMDVCLKFDTGTLTGYGLRIIRTTKHAKAVDFLLVEYDHGRVAPLTAPVSATCYRTGCTIRLTARGNRLSAQVTTTTPPPGDSTLPHEVELNSLMKPSVFGGVHIQHTGSCGESTTMLHRLAVEWQ